MTIIDITGLDKARVLIALYDHATSVPDLPKHLDPFVSLLNHMARLDKPSNSELIAQAREELQIRKTSEPRSRYFLGSDDSHDPDCEVYSVDYLNLKYGGPRKIDVVFFDNFLNASGYDRHGKGAAERVISLLREELEEEKLRDSNGTTTVEEQPSSPISSALPLENEESKEEAKDRRIARMNLLSGIIEELKAKQNDNDKEENRPSISP